MTARHDGHIQFGTLPLALIFAVVGIGFVVALCDRGVLPIAGPFVVMALRSTTPAPVAAESAIRTPGR